MPTGTEVYCRLMDLNLMLQDIEAMVQLQVFLGSIDPQNPALRQLHCEVEAFIRRIEQLVEVAKK